MSLVKQFAAASLAAVVLVLGAVAAPAVALTYPICPNQYTCIWDDPNTETSGGPYAQLLDSNRNFADFTLYPTGSSATNKTEKITTSDFASSTCVRMYDATDWIATTAYHYTDFWDENLGQIHGRRYRDPDLSGNHYHGNGPWSGPDYPWGNRFSSNLYLVENCR